MKITTNGFEILNSGSLTTFNDEPVTFEFSSNLKVKFSFDDGNPDYGLNTINLKINDGIELELQCMNMNKTLGTINTIPTHIGIFQGRQLYLNYLIVSQKENTKQIFYTFYHQIIANES